MFPMRDHRRRRQRRCASTGPGGAHAHLGMAVPGFPNMFVMYGPNTNTSGGSIIVYLEAQAAYMRQALQQLRARGARGDRGARGGRGGQRPRAAGALRGHGLDASATPGTATSSGRIVANWPGYMREYLQRTRALDAAEYRFAAAARPRAPRPERRRSAAMYDYVIVGRRLGRLRARQPPLGGPVGAGAAARGRRQGPLAEDQDPGGLPANSSTPSSTGTSRPSPSRTSTAARCTSRAARRSAARAR